MVSDHRRLAHGLHELAQQRSGAFLGDVGKGNHELIASQPRDRVAGPDGRLNPARDLGEEAIACLVAE
ncbi:hypothetical protein GCM10025876_04270 [Demequina litorisediminis]|uniref:Uncharacterized protein n=1 Tax=Demequina litorisediminis TaxID=1849022 RepID=A0ABQ6I8R6_9MICO|nr:hypothetical protein GCM10025876_04270 [Demequina litorisediminis]